MSVHASVGKCHASAETTLSFAIITDASTSSTDTASMKAQSYGGTDASLGCSSYVRNYGAARGHSLEMPKNKDILVAQRVDTTFHTCIKNSLVLQQRLFFTTTKDSKLLFDYLASGNDAGDETKHNPLVLTAMPLGYRSAPYTNINGLGEFWMGYDCIWGGPLEIRFQDVDATRLAQNVCTNELSYLDIYLQSPLPPTLKLVINNCDIQQTGRILKWDCAWVIVKPGTLGQILDLALSLLKMAEWHVSALQDEWTDEYGWGTEDKWDFDPPGSFKVDWIGYFTTAQMNMLQDEPDVTCSWVAEAF